MKVKSSAIKEVDITEDLILVLKFVGGTTYLYEGVDEEVLLDLILCAQLGDSVGQFYNQKIKDKYEYEKVV